MPANFTLYTVPSGSQFTQTISGDDPADLNDFAVIAGIT